MTVARRLGVDGRLKSELLDDDSRAEVEVLEDDLGEVVIGEALLDRAVRVDEAGNAGGSVLLKREGRLDLHGEGLGNTDGVRELDEDALGKAGSDERLGDPTSVGRCTSDFSGAGQAKKKGTNPQ